MVSFISITWEVGNSSTLYSNSTPYNLLKTWEYVDVINPALAKTDRLLCQLPFSRAINVKPFLSKWAIASFYRSIEIFLIHKLLETANERTQKPQVGFGKSLGLQARSLVLSSHNSSAHGRYPPSSSPLHHLNKAFIRAAKSNSGSPLEGEWRSRFQKFPCGFLQGFVLACLGWWIYVLQTFLPLTSPTAIIYRLIQASRFLLHLFPSSPSSSHELIAPLKYLPNKVGEPRVGSYKAIERGTQSRGKLIWKQDPSSNDYTPFWI